MEFDSYSIHKLFIRIFEIHDSIIKHHQFSKIPVFDPRNHYYFFQLIVLIDCLFCFFRYSTRFATDSVTEGFHPSSQWNQLIKPERLNTV